MAIIEGTYDIDNGRDDSFSFVSSGSNGDFFLVADFEATDDPLVINLGFAVKDGDKYDDKIETNNGDSEKILGTVAKRALDYCRGHPDKWVQLRGSTPSRIRKYQ